ncbi:ABC transporter substrate binding protein [Curvibacter sp. APW13]|uniref:ABC transporter substrate-binding protein n=1 Tax=Curvibacter sp. APW13 TaxID=3077236 RepID=UPI0028E08AB4|nr:ABC transporter substrate binding protein [Curvibacter sp. APW13]MDT8992233.1 ABC transporter substrate binding protein [Curvibacter sp. APW13]
MRFRAGWLGLFWWCAALTAHADVLAILHSERAPSYAAVGEAIQSELEHAGHVVAASYVAEVNGLESLLARSPKVVVTLGAAALRTVLASDTRLPVVASLIPRSAFERVLREPGRKSTGPVHAIYLDQPFSRQLDLMQLVVPDLKHVGVLWGPDSQSLRPVLQAALLARGLQESGATVAQATSVGEATRQVLQESDALLSIADPLVYNSSTVTNILMASYRAKQGVFAFSPAYVKAGALAGLYTTPAQIGAHTAETARQLARGATVPAVQYPVDFTLSVNEHVARSLGLSLDEAALSQRLRRLERKP